MPGKVIIGYVHNGSVCAPFMRAVVNALSYDAERDKLIDNLYEASSSDIVQNRNLVVKGFLENKEAEWLWFLDTDIVFQPDALYELLKVAHPKVRPVVSGLYFSFLSGEFRFSMPVIFRLTATGEYRTIDWIDDAVHEVDGIGMGCALIHRSVLEAVGEAHADDAWKWFGRDQVMISGKPTHLGEDFTLCHRAQKLGYSIWAHLGVRCDHIKTRYESMGTFIQGHKLWEMEHPEEEKKVA